MLTLTADATHTIEQLLESPEAPEAGGLRIVADESPNGDGQVRALRLGLATEPRPSEVVVEDGGARVFIAQTVVRFLDDKRLDAAVDGDRTQFRLRPAA